MGKRGGKHKACIFEKAKTSIWLKQSNYAREQLEYKAEKVGLGQTMEDLLKQTAPRQN